MPCGIADWAHLHRLTLQALLPELRRIPSESTILRMLRAMDVASLEHHIAQFSAQLPTKPCGGIITTHGEIVHGYALDSKAVRGANAHGACTHLVSLVQHGTGMTVAQVAVAEKRNEITARRMLLTVRDLSGSFIPSSTRLGAANS